MMTGVQCHMIQTYRQTDRHTDILDYNITTYRIIDDMITGYMKVGYMTI